MSVALLRNLSLDEFAQQDQRLLPAEVAGLGRNDRRHMLLYDVHVRSTRYLCQSHGHVHVTRKVWVIKRIGVAEPLMRHELKVFAAE